MPGTVAHVVGARPNFMKAAPVIRALERAGVAQAIIHSGQHYDAAMSDVFFRDLGLPEPDRNLGVGSGSHAVQTAAIMVALEQAFGEFRPALAVVYGDVNSTTAAALVAAKIGLPLAHVEAGLRSFDMTHAGGGQPARHRHPLRPLLRHEPGGHGPPRPRGRAGRPDALRRQPDDRHAARQPRPVRPRAPARRARPRPGATRSRRSTGRPTWTTRPRPGDSSRCSARSRPSCRWCFRSIRAAAPRWRRPGWATLRRSGSWSRSVTWTSSRSSAARRWS